MATLLMELEAPRSGARRKFLLRKLKISPKNL
jgi:hypothetical protein